MASQKIIDRRNAVKKASLMLGFAISGPALTGVLNGCSSKKKFDWQPLIFSENEAILVEAASSRILPSGETPGAMDAGVTQFIDEMVSEYYLPEDQQRFQAGLQQLDPLSNETVSSNFAKASEAEQDQVLKELTKRSDLQPFFLMLKELTVLGFFTSKVGATQFLNFDEIPGGFRGCESLESVGGKTWAT
jgi:hypothetical protein